MSIKKRDIEFTSLEEWARLAGPKSPDQWVDDRSAKEVARAWLEGKGITLPPEVNAALIAHAAFGPVRARDAHGEYLIAVEAKADEPFSDTIGKTLENALERYLQNNSSNGINRIQSLTQGLAGARASGDPPVKDLRYQLFIGCAGALCEAQQRGYKRALFLVHEFVTS
jgi:hypothetical protein